VRADAFLPGLAEQDSAESGRARHNVASLGVEFLCGPYCAPTACVILPVG